MIVQQSHTPDGRHAETLAAELERLLGRAVARTLVKYEDETPSAWHLTVAGIEDRCFALDAVARMIDTARAMALGGRRVQLIALCDGTVYAATTRGVHALSYEDGRATLADPQLASIVLEALCS